MTQDDYRAGFTAAFKAAIEAVGGDNDEGSWMPKRNIPNGTWDSFLSELRTHLPLVWREGVGNSRKGPLYVQVDAPDTTAITFRPKPGVIKDRHVTTFEFIGTAL